MCPRISAGAAVFSNRVDCGDQTVIRQHEKRICPWNSVVQGRLQRPEIWSREISQCVKRNVAENVKRRCGKYPRETFPPHPNPCGNAHPDDQAVRDVIRIVGISTDRRSRNSIQRIARPCKIIARDNSCENGRPKGKQVRRHTPEKRPPPGGLAFPAKCRSAPETMREKIHYLTATPR